MDKYAFGNRNEPPIQESTDMILLNKGDIDEI